MAQASTDYKYANQMPVEPEKFPEVLIRDWKFARLLYCCGYWLTRLSRRDDTVKHFHPKYVYHFRMTKAEYHVVADAYFAGELKLAARAFDDGEQQLIRLQKDAMATGAWCDPDA